VYESVLSKVFVTWRFEDIKPLQTFCKDMSQIEELNKRRIHRIVSHPNAGKTTLTEKLLLSGGAIHEAGAVKFYKIKKHTTIDFMKIEKQRRISVATAVKAFDYRDKQE
jgi:peptide subunit release factor RF-3